MTDTGVRILTKAEYPLWDEFVMNSPQGTIFHMSDWITKNAELFSKKENIYGYFINGKLSGGCPIFSDKKYFFISIAVSHLPMTPYGGYIFSEPESSKFRKIEKTQNMIIDEVNNELIKKFDYINIVNSPNIIDIRQFIWKKWKLSIYYTYHFNLNNDFEENLSRNIRRDIRKAIKIGISIKKENNPLVYYELLSKMFEKKHLPMAISKNIFLDIVDMIISKNIGEMWIARAPNGEPVAGDIILWDAKLAHHWSAASDTQFMNTGAPSLLLHEIFHDLKKRNFHMINLMCGNRPSLANFISAINPNLNPYYGAEYISSKIKHLSGFRLKNNSDF